MLHLWFCLHEKNTLFLPKHLLALHCELSSTVLNSHFEYFCGGFYENLTELWLHILCNGTDKWKTSWVEWPFPALSISLNKTGIDLLVISPTCYKTQFEVLQWRFLLLTISFLFNEILESLKLSLLILYFTMQSDRLAEWVCNHY
jgi:hypothetical protein